MSVRKACALGLLLAVACVPQGVRPSGRPAAVLSTDSRVIISDFSDVAAVAASPWFVFGATAHGLLIYDRVARRFRPPVTALDGYPSVGRVRRAVADPSGNAVWLDLGTALGYVRYDVDGRMFTPGLPTFGQGDRPLTVEAALASAPLADAMRAAILTDRRLRTHDFTAAAATPDRPEIFFGTNGLGLVRVDKQTGEWEVLTYGLLAPGVGALTPTPDGIWAAANARPGRDVRRGLTWVARDLSATRVSEGAGAALGFTFLNARRLISAGDALWLATEQGVFRIEPATLRAHVWDMPDATCLAATSRGVWVGTLRGLSLISGVAESAQDIGPRGVAVTSLLAVGDTVWVGTTAGLGQVLPGTDVLATVPGLAERPSLRVTVYAIGRLQDTMVIATERELVWRDPSTAGGAGGAGGAGEIWNTTPLPLSLGVPTAFAVHDDALWIGGTRGLAQVDIGSALFQVHAVPFEVPAAVRDLAGDRDYLWAATDSGLMRIQ